MDRVHIVTDSASQIPEALRQELDIHVVQLPYAWDGETYIDEIDMGSREFYERLRRSKTIPTTSGPTPGAYRSVFEGLVDQGGSILVIHVGHEFSSTHNSARMAKAMFPAADIHIIDSHSDGLGLGFQVVAVARAAREGRALDELIALAEEACGQTGVVFTLNDIGYMQRGGRITFGQRLLASTLNVVPILEINQGPIEMVGRARSLSGAMTKIVDMVQAKVDGRRPVRVGVHHADNEGEAFKLRKIVQERLQPDELIMVEISPILGIHTGPGAIGLAYSFGL